VVRVSLHKLSPAERDAVVAALAEAGVTWILEAFAPGHDASQLAAYVQAGPPPATLAR
jgi:hypothetical protein